MDHTVRLPAERAFTRRGVLSTFAGGVAAGFSGCLDGISEADGVVLDGVTVENHRTESVDVELRILADDDEVYHRTVPIEKRNEEEQPNRQQIDCPWDDRRAAYEIRGRLPDSNGWVVTEFSEMNRCVRAELIVDAELRPGRHRDGCVSGDETGCGFTN